MAPQTLNTTRDIRNPLKQDARGGGNINVNRLSLPLPKASGEQTVIIALFVMLVISLIVNGLDYARGERNIEQIIASNETLRLSQDDLAKAKTDLKTQVWLRSDSLTKENAEIRGHVIAIEDMLQVYGLAKTIPKPKSLPEEK